MMLFTWRFFHPLRNTDITLDCAAETRELALASARRFIDRENARYKRLGIDVRLPIPTEPEQMTLEPVLPPKETTP
jgi:hypothetical protein